MPPVLELPIPELDLRHMGGVNRCELPLSAAAVSSRTGRTSGSCALSSFVPPQERQSRAPIIVSEASASLQPSTSYPPQGRRRRVPIIARCVRFANSRRVRQQVVRSARRRRVRQQVASVWSLRIHNTASVDSVVTAAVSLFPFSTDSSELPWLS